MEPFVMPSAAIRSTADPIVPRPRSNSQPVTRRRRHLQVSSPETQGLITKIIEGGLQAARDYNFTCPEPTCGFQGHKKTSNYHDHLQRHLDKPMICDKCGVEVSSRRNLNRHLKTRKCQILGDRGPYDVLVNLDLMSGDHVPLPQSEWG
ncbi:hypothetical protein BDN72DRAFT_107318 [Pluteus cervinus]|uniref:Uncharacterized protein n=1 Tax=Pluteus cervinus TaxID=181527 RepID=A0ACD3APW2_9AGAR|nr:hypothetical protein BDN72DRAFT_107318 [Pluteus cervinus]